MVVSGLLYYLKYKKNEHGLTQYVPKEISTLALLDTLSNVKSSRKIVTTKAEESINFIYGIVGIYGTRKSGPVFKLHVERSFSENFLLDQQKVISHLNKLANGKKEIIKKVIYEKECYFLSSDIMSGDIVGIVVVFMPDKQLILTFYFFNKDYKNGELSKLMEITLEGYLEQIKLLK